MRLPIPLMAIVVGSFAFLFSCGTGPASFGEVDLTTSGLPVGVQAEITIEGSDGSFVRVTGRSVRTRLPAGTYTVTAEDVVGNEFIVPHVYTTTPESRTVTIQGERTTSVEVPYGPLTGTGLMWVSTGGTASAFGRDQLSSSGTPTRFVSLPSSTEAFAFEADGDVWVSGIDDNGFVLQKFAFADVTNDEAQPVVTIAPDEAPESSLRKPTGMAFDEQGNLWVVAQGSGRLEMFAPDQLASDGAPSPAVILVVEDEASGLLDELQQIAFDAGGTLWLAAQNVNALLGFRPSQLSVSGSPTPAIQITGNPINFLNGPSSLAFDADGNLWVVNILSDTVIRFPPSELREGGSPVPDVVITADTFDDIAPVGLALDHSGGLWVSTGVSDRLHRIADIGSLGGVVTPDVDIVIQSPSFGTGSIAFWPPVPDLPIRRP